MVELLKFATCTTRCFFMIFYILYFVVYWFVGFGLQSHTFEMRSGMSFPCPSLSRIALTTLPVTSGVWVLFSTRLAWSFPQKPDDLSLFDLYPDSVLADEYTQTSLWCGFLGPVGEQNPEGRGTLQTFGKWNKNIQELDPSRWTQFKN